MSLSHFRRMAAQSYRLARSCLEPHDEFEALMRRGREFKAKATRAAARVAAIRGVRARRQESERQEALRDSGE
jgi:hypothetical protein